MKTYFLTAVAAVLLVQGCGESLTGSRYVLQLPEIPAAWETMLGSPCWRIEWINDQGQKESRVIEGGCPEITMPHTWASPVLAWPLWPEKGLSTGIFMPAGAIFPFDVHGSTLVLSWQGGIDAVLYRELAKAGSNGDAGKRQPHLFDWPRFRELFDDPSFNADVRADPWLANWPYIAQRIVQSGFDRRRLVPEGRSSLSIPVGPGPWVGTSPFAAPLFFENTPVFPVRGSADTWVSDEGILKCNNAAWIFIDFQAIMSP